MSAQLSSLLSCQNGIVWTSLSLDKIKLLSLESLAKIKQNNGSLWKVYVFLPTVTEKWIS